ncbi:hypothetical protein SUGI_0870170, partial [Cryptomeria japonica]
DGPVDEYNTLTSWHGFNCCTWLGVSCNLRTGRVYRLDLSGNYLEGNISSSLFQLAQLEHLDLSHNLFKDKFSPPHNPKLKSLTFLDLSFAGYVNESSLDSVKEFYVSLESLSNLVSLEYLSLAGVNISVKKEWGEVSGSLSNLQQLSMSDCGLGGQIPNFPSEPHLSPSSRSIIQQVNWGSFPSRLTLPKYFHYLDLHNNSLEGVLPFPPAGPNLLMNQFNGSIPTDIGAYLQNTRFLSLSRNNFSGAIPESICTPYLQVLDLSNNTLSSVIPTHLTRNCSFLSVLDLAENHLEGKMPAEWGNITKVHTLKLNGNHLRGVIPSSI